LVFFFPCYQGRWSRGCLVMVSGQTAPLAPRRLIFLTIFVFAQASLRNMQMFSVSFLFGRVPKACPTIWMVCNRSPYRVLVVFMQLPCVNAAPSPPASFPPLDSFFLRSGTFFPFPEPHHLPWRSRTPTSVTPQ